MTLLSSMLPSLLELRGQHFPFAGGVKVATEMLDMLWILRLQYPLVKEYSLHYSRIPDVLLGIFLN